MRQQAPTWPFRTDLPWSQRYTLAFLVACADSKGALVSTMAAIAQECGLSFQAVRTHVQELQRVGWIEFKQVPVGDRRKHVHIQIREPVQAGN